MLFDPGCCGCETPALALWRVYVPSCQSIQWPSAFVALPEAGIEGAVCSLYSDPSRTVLVASGVTDAVGRADIPVPAFGAYYVRISHPNSRFTARDFTVTFSAFAPSVSQGYQLGTNPAYTCAGFCRWPVHRTLYATTPFGPAVLQSSGGAWEGTATYPWGGNANCPAGDVAIIVGINSTTGTMSFGGLCQHNSSVCPGGGFTYWSGFGVPLSSTSVCPPGAVYLHAEGTVNVATVSFPSPASGIITRALVGNGIVTHTYTATE